MKKRTPTITSQEVEERLHNGEKLNIIDVREVDEVADGKIREQTDLVGHVTCSHI